MASHNSNSAQYNSATYMGQAQNSALLSFFIPHIWLAKWAKPNIWPIYFLGYSLFKVHIFSIFNLFIYKLAQ
jgi:hypothetical protein